MTFEYSYSIEINSPQERTFNYLADFYNMKTLHPFVQEVKQLEPEGAIRKYEITDSIKILCCQKNVYLNILVIEQEYPSLIRSRTDAGFGVRTLGALKVDKLSEDKCRVWSKGTVECNWLFRGKTQSDLGFAHTRMLEKLKEVMENGEKND